MSWVNFVPRDCAQKWASGETEVCLSELRRPLRAVPAPRRHSPPERRLMTSRKAGASLPHSEGACGAKADCTRPNYRRAERAHGSGGELSGTSHQTAEMDHNPAEKPFVRVPWPPQRSKARKCRSCSGHSHNSDRPSESARWSHETPWRWPAASSAAPCCRTRFSPW